MNPEPTQVNHVTVEPLSAEEVQEFRAWLAHRAQAQPQPPAETLDPRRSKVKVNKPIEFSGDRSKTREFIGQCRLVFYSDPATYAVPDLQITYACSFLRARAFNWMLNLREQSNGVTPLFDTFDDFATALQSTFGLANTADRARSKIRTIRQKSSVSDYSIDFNYIAIDTQFNDESLKMFYHDGLKDEVKDLLLTLPEPKTLALLQTAAINCDNRIYRRLMEGKKATPRTLHPTPSHSHSSTLRQGTPERSRTDSSGFAPMQLDNVNITTSRRGPISSAEKKRRWDNKLCLYCGDAGHIRETCPKKQSTRIDIASVDIVPVEVSSVTQPEPEITVSKFIIDAIIWSGENSTNVKVFLDSGCTGMALMSSSFARKHCIPLEDLQQQRKTILHDGRLADTITKRTLPISLSIDGHFEELSFLIINYESERGSGLVG